jgi:glycosyltransferase involved in cell wall biosynthesis
MMRVAFDTGPLHGPITGVGRAVEAMAAHATVDLVPYVLSFRANLRPNTVRLPYPAALALRSWGRFDHPRPDRHLGDVALVHGTNYVVPPSRRPRLVTVYDCWALEHPDTVHRDIGLMMNALRRAIHTGAHVHASSHATAERLRTHFPDASITVIHLGAPAFVDARAGSIDGLPDDGPVILSIGTLERRKNLPFLVSLMNDVIGKVPAARLVIAGGDGDDAIAVRSAVENSSARVRERVHLLGRVNDEVVGRLYHRAKVIAYPSLDEGFGFPLLDAMQADLPIVASRAGSIPEVAGDAAEFCDATDVDGLGECLVRAITDSERRAQLVEAGRRRVDQFTWSSTVDGLVELYRRLAD